MALGAALDNCLRFSFAKYLTDPLNNYLRLMFVYDVVLAQCKKITKVGGVPNLQSAHAVFRLGKPSFKRKIYFNLRIVS